MKKRSIIIMVLIIGAHLSGQCQFKLKPITLAGVSAIKPYALPAPAFTVRGLSGRIVGSYDVCPTSCNTVLPLTALELTGHRIDNYLVALDWKTKNELHSKGFDIERSLGNTNNFLVVGNTASATGTSVEKKYATRDMNSYQNVSFYRVKQIDLDGHFAYSNTIEVRGYNAQQKASLSPDPADDNTTLTCYSATAGTGKIRILSALGQNIYQANWPLSAGNNSINLSVAKYLPGSYYVQLTWPDNYRSSMKLVIK